MLRKELLVIGIAGLTALAASAQGAVLPQELPDGEVSVNGVSGWYFPSGKLEVGHDPHFYTVGTPTVGNLSAWVSRTASFLGTGNPELPLQNATKVPVQIAVDGKLVTVTAIDGAFENSVAAQAQLPDCINFIGDRSFYNAAEIKTLTLPIGLTLLGREAFCGMKSLEGLYFRSPLPPACTVNIGDSYKEVLEIGDSPSVNTANYSSPFEPDKGVAAYKLYIPRGSRTFYLRQAAIARMSDFIEEYDEDLTMVYGGVMQDGLSFVSVGNFQVEVSDYSGMQMHLKLPADVKELKYPFADLPADATSETIGIGYRALYGRDRLETVTFSEGIVYVKDEAMAGCSAETVTASADLNFVGERAFADMKKLKSFILPKRVDEKSRFNWDVTAFDGLAECATLYYEEGDVRVNPAKLPWSRFASFKPLESAVEEVTATESGICLDITGRDGVITICNVGESGASVEVCDLSGRRIGGGEVAVGSTLELRAGKGVYIVKSDNIQKIMI